MVDVGPGDLGGQTVALDPVELAGGAGDPVDGGATEGRPCDGAADRTVTGRVVDGRGRPWPNAWVFARREPAAPAPEAGDGPWSLEHDTEAAPPSASTLTDSRGQFSLAHLCDASYRVSAHSLTTLGRANLAGVCPGDRLSLTLGGPATLLLHVQEHGEPAPRFDVLLRGPVTRRERVEDVEGECRLRWLEPGTYELAVVAEGGAATRSIALDPDAVESLAVELSPPRQDVPPGDAGPTQR
ncbi:MAG: hypothetical protein JOZ69_09225 [Myxococcales bacterium]|nr:hypothetical protein [Myxococcales bacterium]